MTMSMQRRSAHAAARGRSFALLALIGCVALPAPVTALTEDDCDADRLALYEALETGRASEVRRLDHAIGAATSRIERERLIVARDKAWDVEERHRATADINWRDCVAHVQRTRTTSE